MDMIKVQSIHVWQSQRIICVCVYTEIPIYIEIYTHIHILKKTQDWEDGSVIKRTWYSCRRHESSSQYSYNDKHP